MVPVISLFAATPTTGRTTGRPVPAVRATVVTMDVNAIPAPGYPQAVGVVIRRRANDRRRVRRCRVRIWHRRRRRPVLLRRKAPFHNGPTRRIEIPKNTKKVVAARVDPLPTQLFCDEGLGKVSVVFKDPIDGEDCGGCC